MMQADGDGTTGTAMASSMANPTWLIMSAYIPPSTSLRPRWPRSLYFPHFPQRDQNQKPASNTLLTLHVRAPPKAQLSTTFPFLPRTAAQAPHSPTATPWSRSQSLTQPRAPSTPNPSPFLPLYALLSFCVDHSYTPVAYLGHRLNLASPEDSAKPIVGLGQNFGIPNPCNPCSN